MTKSRSSSRASVWGVQERYKDYLGKYHDISESSIERVIDIMSKGEDAPPRQSPVHVVLQGSGADIGPPSVIVLEDSGEIASDGRLPDETPLGYHVLKNQDGSTASLIVSPGTCVTPSHKLWGWALQLYSLRSKRDWGIGDLKDLALMAEWSRSKGAEMLMVNPLSATLPMVPKEPSPYYPSSRGFIDPLYLSILDLPGSQEALAADATHEAESLNRSALVDRDRSFVIKMKLLDDLYERFGSDPAFDRYLSERGDYLESFATFNAIAEIHRSGWTGWPDELRDPASAAVGQFKNKHSKRIRFHQWVQWQLDVQLENASRLTALVQDLAIGVNPDGADAWMWQDVFARDVSVGAPPDKFNTQGQNWAVPPFDPWALRARSYVPFIQTLRNAMRHCQGLRIDHVMGLFRLFWIPKGLGPSEGAYVEYPYTDLFRIVALESHRAGAWIVGEDLGTIEPHVRDVLAEHEMLSYRLLIFEGTRSSRFPRHSLAAVSTHDLPTVEGLWSGTDLREQERLGLQPNVESTLKMVERLASLVKKDKSASTDAVVKAAYTKLASSDSLVVAASLEDALLVSDRPNIPATTDERPNWKMRLPVAIEELEDQRLVNEVAQTLSNQRRPHPAD